MSVGRLRGCAGGFPPAQVMPHHHDAVPQRQPPGDRVGQADAGKPQRGNRQRAANSPAGQFAHPAEHRMQEKFGCPVRRLRPAWLTGGRHLYLIRHRTRLVSTAARALQTLVLERAEIR